MTKPIVRDRMDPTWKKRWLKALRSGKYKQSRDALNDGKGFCCLGVLCDVVAKYPKSGGGGNWLKANGEIEFDFNGETDAGSLPTSLSELVGLNNEDPEVLSGGKRQTLSRWNDRSKLSFERIANIIEREL